MRTRADDAASIDVAYLATTYDVPETSLQSLIDTPTTDLVKELLNSLTIKGHQSDTLKAEKLRVDVELENTFRTSETKIRAQKAAVTRHVKEVEELRTKLNESEAAREALATELEQLRSSSSGSSAETQTLRQRIETLEASNRDALVLVESKSTEKDRLATELSEQHSKLLVLRREASQLEERNQSLENAASSQRFKEQSLSQEIDLLKRNNEWHANELQTRTQEHGAFRKEKNARISALQRELEESSASVEALKRTEATLRQRLDELQAKADEAFTRIASLQEEAAKKDQDFRTELSSSRRLSELQAQNAATHKARLLEIQNQLEQLSEQSREELGKLQAEIETERMDKEDVERKVAELELKVEDLQRRPARPSTPRQNGGLDPQTLGRGGSRAGSPSALPGSMRKVVGGLSFTQLYTQYVDVQEELENERRRSNKLTAALDELLTEVETKKPELEEARADADRLEQELLSYSTVLDEANAARDTYMNDYNQAQDEANASKRRGELLEQQLRDLSAQIKILLVEIQSRDQGLGEMSADERLELERAARGELDEASLGHLSDTARLISERLIIFHNVAELQDQNATLIASIRDLGEQMEGAEARKNEIKSAAQEIEELNRKIKRYEDELAATATQINSYVKERDMFRRMLQHRGQLAPDADIQSMFGQSLAPATPQRNSVGPPATPRSKDIEDLNKLLKEQQTFFDQYRNESSTDRQILKDQVDNLSREKSNLQTELARAQSRVDLAAQRYEMLEQNLKGMQEEHSQIKKRAEQMAEQAAKQDLHTQQVAEQLVEERSMKESLRNENANIKAEKELWKRIEARLTEDNKSLVDERSRLNKLTTDLQNLQNERELAESENRRRLQGRIETVESELNETKKKLESEIEESRKSALRREYDENQSRIRTNDLVKSLGNVREELVAAKTTRDQLQSRVEELRIELQSAEEKVTALQPRSTSRPEPGQNGEQQTSGDSDELPAEQRLALELSELRRDLELSKAELESAKQQVEQFRAIAQSTEEELANFNQTADQYKEDTDRLVAEKDAKIQELQQRVEDLSAELTATNNELSEHRTKADDSTRLLTEQKASFESELTRLRSEVDSHTGDKKIFQKDIQAQAEIAQQAQQSYEDELLKHAEAARALQSVRKEYNDLRIEVAGLRAEAEAAKSSLERGEESWSEQRERFESEFEEAKRKRHDIDEQNKILHRNLESFSNELAALRQGRAADADTREGSPSTSQGGRDLQDVIKFLRREKEIVDVQYELSIQEAKRLQQQFDYASNQLEETRQKLAEERRQSADRANTESSTSKLAQTINELNLFRESATTLRNEARQAREKLEEKGKEVERLTAEVEPLKGRVSDLEGELEGKEGEMDLLQKDRDRWQERTQNIISKYDRVDPAELEEMKQQMEQLKAEKERLEAEQIPLREQVTAFDARFERERAALAQNFNERLDKVKTQAKDQNSKKNEKIREALAEKASVAAELEKVNADLGVANTELEQTKTALEEARTNASKAEEPEEGQVQEDSTAAGDEEHAALHARIAEAEASASEHVSRAEALAAQVQTLQARVKELEGQVAQLQQQLEAARDPSNTQAESAETLEKLRQDLATAQQEVESLHNSAATSQSFVNAEVAPGEKSVAEQVKEEVDRLRTEMEAQHELAKKQMEDEYNASVEKHKTNLRRELEESQAKELDQVRQELVKEHSAEIQRLQDEHTAAITKLQEEHQAELERLSRDAAVAVNKVESADVKPGTSPPIFDVTKIELTDEQAWHLVKNNSKMKEICQKSIRRNVEAQTDKAKATIETKEAEIAQLKAALERAPSREAGPTPGDMITREELEAKLETAKKEKEAAVKQTNEVAEKKAKLMVSSRDIAMAKISAVRKAVQETPEKSVREVWEVADKARPAPPKTAPSTASAAPSSPAVAKPAQPPTPTTVKSTEPPTSAHLQGSPSTQTPEQIEAAKLRARAERFGTGPAATSNSTTPAPGGLFGKPSAPLPTGSFGQPSAPAPASPNPQAAEFNPAANDKTAPANNASTGPATARSASQSGIPQPGGGVAVTSRLPQGPVSRRTSTTGNSGLQIQGAAQGQRGGQSGLPRGGFRGGRGSGRGGPAANAGQKRQHDGAGGGGDAKRSRSRGPSAGGS